METLEYSFIDKSKWARGPWDEEPDKVQWQDERTGLPCLAVRHPSLGQLCGYVAVKKGHPYYKRSDEEKFDVFCHGGVTFSGACDGDEEKGICHKPAVGEPDNVWWIGFDCAHAGDLAPGLAYTISTVGGKPWHEDVYRDLAYVKNQCANLAQQLCAVEALADVEGAARSML